jgi:hypothetical protein
MADSKKDDATSSFNDMSEFMQKMWNPFGVPMPGFGVPGSPTGIPGAAPFAGMPGGMPFPNPAAMFATIDPAELGRKIDEMRVIETWLQMSINMMQFSIKTMELQKASLEALRSAHAPGSEKSPPGKRNP